MLSQVGAVRISIVAILAFVGFFTRMKVFMRTYITLPLECLTTEGAGEGPLAGMIQSVVSKAALVMGSETTLMTTELLYLALFLTVYHVFKQCH